MGRNQGEGLIIFHIDAPCIMEASGVLGIKPTVLVTEAHILSINKVNPIVALSIYIYIFLLIYLVLLICFISLNLIVAALVPILASSTSTLALLHIDELFFFSTIFF